MEFIILVVLTLIILAITFAKLLLDSTGISNMPKSMGRISKISTIMLSALWLVYSIVIYCKHGFSSKIRICIIIAICICIIFIVQCVDVNKKSAENIVEIWDEDSKEFIPISKYTKTNKN